MLKGKSPHIYLVKIFYFHLPLISVFFLHYYKICPIEILHGSSKLKQEFSLLNVVLPLHHCGLDLRAINASIYRRE